MTKRLIRLAVVTATAIFFGSVLISTAKNAAQDETSVYSKRNAALEAAMGN